MDNANKTDATAITDGTTQTPSFSPLTCYQLIDKLDDEQLCREFQLHIDPSLLTQSPKTVSQKRISLKTQFKKFVFKDYDDQLHLRQTLMTQFACDVAKAGSQVVKLQSALSEAQDVIDRLREERPSLPDPSLSPPSSFSGNIPLSTAPSSDTGTVISNNMSAYTILTGSLSNFDASLLEASTDFNINFNNRSMDRTTLERGPHIGGRIYK